MQSFIGEVRAALDALSGRYTTASSAGAAEIILYLAPGYNRFRSWTTRVLAEEAVERFPDRCFVYDFSDRPVVFMPGLYVSLRKSRVDGRRVRAADRWTRIPARAERSLLDASPTPGLLFSFRGSESAAVRRCIFEYSFGRSDIAITRTTRWWDYADEETARVEYLREIRDSAFVLCPRGLAPSTYRLYEVMQLGRVPVILADDWAPSAGVPWQDFSVRVSEAEVAELPRILDRLRPFADEMGRAARRTWEQCMQPGPVLLRRWLRELEEIVELRPPDWDEAGQRRRWRSSRFQWDNGIHPVQGLWRAARDGTLPEKLRSSIRG